MMYKQCVLMLLDEHFFKTLREQREPEW